MHTWTPIGTFQFESTGSSCNTHLTFASLALVLRAQQGLMVCVYGMVGGAGIAALRANPVQGLATAVRLVKNRHGLLLSLWWTGKARL